MLTNVLTIAVALLHVYFLVLEMFLWTTPRGMKTFGTKPDFAKATATLAANQGLYNGFLAAGLFYSMWISAFNFQIFFLLCVLVAGVYGGLTANKKIMYVQALPAVLALAAATLLK